MSRVAEVLQVSRSTLHDRQSGKTKSRGPYAKVDDEALLRLIRRFVDERPTYGYRRITALVHRELAENDQAPANHKRVYRIMKRHGLLLQRHTADRPGRVHDGKVMVMASNLRWCSDTLEFTCWNGEVVHLAFGGQTWVLSMFAIPASLIDAFDREIIAFVAVTGSGISGSDIRDMMLEAVEKRFGTTRAPHAIEHLSDNGSPYIARDTRGFAMALNLIPCFTPVRSPESNGMSEAFVKTFKRDYVRVNPLPDAETVLRLTPGWIDDYNEIHPHSALRMRSPREFIQAQTQ